MSTPVGSSHWMYSSGAGSFYPYSIDQSLRFNDSDVANLNRTPSSAGNRQTWTWSAWVKRSTLSTTQYLFAGGSNADNATYIRFFSNDKFQIFHYDANSATNNVQTEQLFRDVSSWYHIVLAVDTTQATAADRVKIFVNGERVTNFTTATYPSLNFNYDINTTGSHRIGANYAASGTAFDGYMAEVHFIDGTQYAASDFGETINGIWVPKEVSGLTYGTNGFYLSFADSSAIGDDLSGNTNDWTANNLAASDVVPDSPTNNFAVMNPLDSDVSWTVSEGNLRTSITGTAGDNENIASTTAIPNSTPIYFEAVPINTDTGSCGVGKLGMAELAPATTGNTYLYFGAASAGGGNAKIYSDGSLAYDTGATWSSDILGVAVDMANSKVWFSKNGTWLGSGTQDPETNTGGYTITADEVIPYSYKQNSSTTNGCIFNFGQDSTFVGTKTAGGNADGNGVGDFKYAPPSGFLALCSANLPEPTIGPNSDTQADDYFNTVLYTGDGSSSRGVTGVNFAPDWVILKKRNGTGAHFVYDTIRGATNGIHTNLTDAETTYTDGLLSFDSDGFTVGSRTNHNGSGDSFVSWNWKAGGSSDTFNIDGTGYATASDAGLSGGNIAADAASINTTSGISILKYTGDGSGSPYSTIKHGLSSIPELYICKSLDSGNADNWVFFHTLVDGTHDFMYLNLTNANSNSAINFPPTITTVKVGGNATNENNKNFLMIAMHSVESYSKFGKYVGNGSTNGTFVYTGFRPAWVMIKKSSGTDGWSIYDSAREPINVMDTRLSANLNNAEVSGSNIELDSLSNGFKLKGTGTTINTSGQTYIYLAFAEAPFKYANAR